MTSRDLITSSPVTLRADASVADAVALLLGHRIRSLVVVDDQGVFKGVFGLHTLMLDILPKVASLDQGMDLSFLRSSVDDLKRRYQGLAREPVAAHLEPESPTVGPDESLMETIRYLVHSQQSLPVVEPGTGRFLGLVTYWDVLRRLVEPGP